MREIDLADAKIKMRVPARRGAGATTLFTFYGREEFGYAIERATHEVSASKLVDAPCDAGRTAPTARQSRHSRPVTYSSLSI
jgi:hypothetical protein